MTKSENNMKILLEQLDHKMTLNLTGSYRLKVSHDWKKVEQSNQNQHILFVKSGCGTYNFDDHIIDLEPGSLIYVSSKYKHNATHSTDNPLVIHGLRFDFISDHQLNHLPTEPFSLGIKVDNLYDIDAIFMRLHQLLYPLNQRSHQLACNSLTTYLLTEIYNQSLMTTIEQNGKHHKVELLRSFMMQTFTSNISIGTLAESVNISERHLRTCFKEKYGLSPKQYQLKLKMDYAKFLLETTNMTVKSVSIALGYSDPFVFSRQFKGFFGISPSALH